MRNVPG